MAQLLLPSKVFIFLVISFLPPLFHSSCFPPICLAKKPPFDIRSDASALVALRDHLLTNNILSHNWTYYPNISVANSICHWIGVTCGSRHQRVVALDLGNMGLVGTIPSYLANLSLLAFLDMSDNKFHGQLPAEMAGLRRLSFIDVSFNSLSGNIPAWFGLLPQLKYLYIHNNSFTGPIPPSLSNASKLENLDISSNLVNGMIPVELGDLHNLKQLDLSLNQLTGEIPHSIFNLTLLETFRLFSNKISGFLPEDMCTSLPKLRILNLFGNELEGHIQSSLKFCSRLERLSLAYNKFHGPLTAALGNLTMLNVLYLGGNNLKGGIPGELASLVKLKMLGLERAGLGGSIPPSIFKNITSLVGLNLIINSVSGSIPNEIGNCTSINAIIIEDNQLTGQVPEPMGRLQKLETLSLGVNNLEGHVPANIFNITSLRFLVLSVNHFTGHIPPTIGLPYLEQLSLSGNRFSGTIPDSISNSSRLTHLDLLDNSFMGSPSIMLGNLRMLEYLSMDNNNLRINGTEFIASLNSCRHLRHLSISSNQVNGLLPSSFGNLTSSLQLLAVASCRIVGKIPYDIGNMSNLEILDLSSNQLVGPQALMLQGLSHLEQFFAQNNNLRGLFPVDICHLRRLGRLYFQINKLSGALPDCLGNITTLRYLYLNDNKLSSRIPASLWTLEDILELDMSSNSFTGYFPQDIGTLRAPIYINLSMNQLSGTLPSAIGSLQTLAYFSLAHNKFEGTIPESFGKLVSMEELDLSYNNLSGEIPNSLQALSRMKILNLSFNRLSGEIPGEGPFKNFTYLSFESNGALCGSPRFHVRQCKSGVSSKHLTKRRKVLFAYVLTGITMLTLVVLAIMYVMLKCRTKHRFPSVEDLEPAVTHEQISYYELQRATNSFDDSNLLGTGSFGSVYKGVFADGRIWAVKVFKLQMERAIRSFDTECEILRNIRHRNLTKVISSCTNLDFMALVLEYMPNGSLDKWLYSHNYILDVEQRLDIMIDVASALDYLHHGCSVPVVHCDLKPNNVLLDEDMVAHVSDFGISKLLKEKGSSAQTSTLATIGYTAPEYGQEGIVSTRCDVYSYGIMLMELFTRRNPTEEMFCGDLDLKHWVKHSIPEHVVEVVDENLVRQDEDKVSDILQCVSDILGLAINCASDSPDERMNIKDVLASLKKIKIRFLASRK